MGLYDGKRVLITGGASGIGLATAKLLLDEGARVLVTGRIGASLAAARDLLGPAATVVGSDAALLDAITALAGAARDILGELDALLICAGQTRFLPLEEMTEEALRPTSRRQREGPLFHGSKARPRDGGGRRSGHDHVGGRCARHSHDQRLRRKQGGAALDGSVFRARASTAGHSRQRGQPRAHRQRHPRKIDAGRGRRTDTSGDDPGEPDGAVWAAGGGGAMAFLAFDATYTTGAELFVDGGATQL